MKYSTFQLALRYLGYYISASNGRGHGIHSPFVFDFIKNVLNDRSSNPDYLKVEELRQRLLKDNTLLPEQDFGAGSATGGSRSIGATVRSAAKNPKLGQLLYRIARRYKPSRLLELGSSLGISSAYLALAVPGGKLVTCEGNRSVAAAALNNFRKTGLTNIEMVVGPFEDTLPKAIGSSLPVDLAFIDGNHRLEPTLAYFSQLVPAMSASSVIVFDDIHWSREMEAAWKKVTEDPRVMTSIDLFFLGLVFFRPDFKVKQHFTIRF